MIRFFSRRFISFKYNRKRCRYFFLFLIILAVFILYKGDEKISMFISPNMIYQNLQVPCNSHNVTITPNYVIKSNETFCKNIKLKKILVLFSKSNSPNHPMRVVLNSLKVEFDDMLLNNFFDIGFHKFKLSFSLLIVEDLSLFYKQDTHRLLAVLEYCRRNSVEIIAFIFPYNSFLKIDKIGNLPLYGVKDLTINNLYISNNSSFLHVTKGGSFVDGVFSGRLWSFLFPTDNHFEVIAFSKCSGSHICKDSKFENVYDYYGNNDNDRPFKPIILRDFGHFDGINKTIFGTDLNHWMSVVIFMDTLRQVCHLEMDLTRLIQIDIDDIFVGKTGTRMLISDVDDLIDYQNKWSLRFVTDFQFNLGFSGFYFLSGNSAENAADEYLISKKDYFTWFPHMWSHKKPHLLSVDKLAYEMENNFEFSKKFQLNVSSRYAIAPFHSGVYPVYDILYHLWKRIWNISVTATEEYPKLNPPRNRKGFIYLNISVLPRQTCGIYTHTLFLDKYPRGKASLDHSILGGSLFFTILFNYVNIFMTHFSNYGNDRLGTYTFDSLFRFVNCYTNLKFVQKSPSQAAKIYFQKYPSEMSPLWMNPCTYNRHKALLPISYSCNKLPQLVIVGPQKTGTTALHKFLNLHPDISSNIALNDTFEEVQFFSSGKYQKGIQWYMDLFSDDGNEKVLKFEKSATYFDNASVPRLMHFLLPDAKVIILLMNPILRAYSWYQHVLAHRDQTAMEYSFHEVVTTMNSSDDNLVKLRRRCLEPGLYYENLKRWITFYSPTNIILLDSDHIRRDPVSLMNGLQHLLPVKRKIDYSNLLVFNEKKKFFCIETPTATNSIACLGPGKGRRYERMGNGTYEYLHHYYLPYNKQLIKLLLQYQYTSFPSWLKDINRDL